MLKNKLIFQHLLNKFSLTMKRANGCNSKLLAELIAREGRPVRKIAEEMEGISDTLLLKLRKGNYPFVVKEEHRAEICRYFNLSEESEDSLFPLGKTKGKKKKAS